MYSPYQVKNNKTKTIQQELQTICSGLDLFEVASKIGYANTKKGEKRIRKVINDKNLDLVHGGWDGVLGSEGFLKKLFAVIGLNLNQSNLQKEFNEIQLTTRDENFGFQSWIFVQTNFKRSGQSILSLAFLENNRRLKINKSIKRLGHDAQIKQLRKIVDKHYNSLEKIKDDGAIINFWGKVDHYVCHIDKEKVISLYPNGQIKTELDHNVNHGGAVLSLK